MAKYEKQITLGTDPLTGKRIRTRIRAETKSGLEAAKKEALLKFGKEGKQSKITLGQYRKRWFETYCSHLAEHTQYCYRTNLHHLVPLDHKQMAKITRTDLQQIINGMWDRPNAVKKIHALMRQIWKSAVIDGVIEKNITDGLNRPKCPKSDRRALSDEEQRALRSVKLPEMERFFVDLLMQFGLRPQEALALMPKDFDRKARTLTISKAVTYSGRTIIKGTKTGVTRVLPVPDEFWQKIPTAKSLYFFVEDGKLMTQKRANKMFRRIIDATNEEMGGTKDLRIANFTMYNLRHTKATQLYYMEGISTKKKAQYLGHSELMFLQVYSHLDEDKEATEQLRRMVI